MPIGLVPRQPTTWEEHIINVHMKHDAELPQKPSAITAMQPRRDQLDEENKGD